MTLLLVEVFLLKVFSFTTLLWKTFLREYGKVILIMFFYDISCKYKNTFNNNKLLKETFITKKIIINQKLLLQKNINIYYIVKKINK